MVFAPPDRVGPLFMDAKNLFVVGLAVYALIATLVAAWLDHSRDALKFSIEIAKLEAEENIEALEHKYQAQLKDV